MPCGRAPRDEVAEGAQLVLLLGGHDEHPVRAAAAPSASGLHGAGADPRPGERAERDAAVAEQAQRAQQLGEHLAPVRERRARVVVLGA